MDLFDIARMLWRRSYVVLPIGAVTLAVALLVQVNTPPEYEATGFLQLQTPELDRADDPTSATIDPVALSQGIAIEVDASFSVSPLEGQYFTINAAAETAEAAETAVDQVITDLSGQITALQDTEGIPAAERADLRMAVPEVTLEVQENATYLASARMFLYNAAATAPENPYRPDASTGRLLQVAAMGDAGQQRFDDLAGEEVEFMVGQDSRDAAALLEVLTFGPDAQTVVDAFYDVQTLMAEDLAARQARADVAESRRITIEVLDAPLEATDVSPPVSRAVVGIIGLGGLLALGAAVGVESLESMRSGKGRDETDDQDSPPVDGNRDDDAAKAPSGEAGPEASEALGASVEVPTDAVAADVGDRTDRGTPGVDEGALPSPNGHSTEARSAEPEGEATDGGPVPGPIDSEQEALDLVEINEALAATTRERDDE